MLQQGDRIFYTDNFEGTSNEYCFAAIKVIKDLSLAPFFYVGTDLKTRRSSLDAEIREDFYKAKAIILVLGRGGGWRRNEDNWAIPEMKHAFSMGIKCLIYTTAKMTEEEVKSLQLPVDPIVIKDEKELEVILKQTLEKLL